jgi:hypothetical protein
MPAPEGIFACNGAHESTQRICACADVFEIHKFEKMIAQVWDRVLEAAQANMALEQAAEDKRMAEEGNAEGGGNFEDAATVEAMAETWEAISDLEDATAGKVEVAQVMVIADGLGGYMVAPSPDEVSEDSEGAEPKTPQMKEEEATMRSFLQEQQSAVIVARVVAPPKVSCADACAGKIFGDADPVMAQQYNEYWQMKVVEVSASKIGRCPHFVHARACCFRHSAPCLSAAATARLLLSPCLSHPQAFAGFFERSAHEQQQTNGEELGGGQEISAMAEDRAAKVSMGGLRCESALLETGNECEGLQRIFFGCPAGCEVSVGPDQPAYVSAAGDPNRGKCLTNGQPETSTCEASHPATMRLCTCVPIDTSETTSAGVSAGGGGPEAEDTGAELGSQKKHKKKKHKKKKHKGEDLRARALELRKSLVPDPDTLSQIAAAAANGTEPLEYMVGSINAPTATDDAAAAASAATNAPAFSHEDAELFCRQEGGRLCTVIEICPQGPSRPCVTDARRGKRYGKDPIEFDPLGLLDPVSGARQGVHITPVADGVDEWLHIGSDGHEESLLCRPHKERGRNGSARTSIGTSIDSNSTVGANDGAGANQPSGIDGDDDLAAVFFVGENASFENTSFGSAMAQLYKAQGAVFCCSQELRERKVSGIDFRANGFAGEVSEDVVLSDQPKKGNLRGQVHGSGGGKVTTALKLQANAYRYSHSR